MNEDGIRIDKWLWRARFFKSRAQASRLCQDGKVRVDGSAITKAHHTLRPGDVVTFPRAREIMVVRVLSLGTRRGPAAEARLLYEEILAGSSAGAVTGRPQRNRPYPGI